MQETILRLLTDTAAFTVAGALLLFAARKLLLRSIEHHFSRLADMSKATIELEKDKETFLSSTRRSVYPEIVELVYRLRNDFREGLEGLRAEAVPSAEQRWRFPRTFDFGEPLYHLTERLYKYRVFVPKEVFDDLHRFKRCLQDATIILNRLDRPVDGTKDIEDLENKRWETFRQRRDESLPKLDALYHEIDPLYMNITDAISAHMESVLSRKSNP